MRRLFFVNALSERVARKGSSLSALASERGIECHILGDFKDLPDQVARVAQDQIEQVYIEGGDGTVQSVLSEFIRQIKSFKTLPSFGLVPGGMTNQVAKNIGLRSARQTSVAAILDRDQISTRNCPLLQVSEPEGLTYSGFLFSTGALPQVTRYTTSHLHTKGIGGSLAVVGAIFKAVNGESSAMMSPTPVRVATSDITHSGPHLGTVVTTLPSIILGLDPFWGEADAPLRLTWIEGEYKHLGRNIFSLWAGRKKDRTQDGFHSTNTHSISYSYDGPVVLDGEFLSFPSGKFTVNATQPLTFLRA